MTPVEDVLAGIDAVLEDSRVSQLDAITALLFPPGAPGKDEAVGSNAMRWRPAPPDAPEPGFLALPRGVREAALYADLSAAQRAGIDCAPVIQTLVDLASNRLRPLVSALALLREAEAWPPCTACGDGSMVRHTGYVECSECGHRVDTC